MNRYYLSLGSNIEPQKNIEAALRLLPRKFQILGQSSIYETDPVGDVEGGKFWNLAVHVQTVLEKDEAIQFTKEIENELGRSRDPQNKFSPRTIDIDILPYPGFEKHGFVVIPLAELDPNGKCESGSPSFGKLADLFDHEIKNYKKVKVMEVLDFRRTPP